MSDKKRVLIAYATAGIGHKKASLAVEEALRTVERNADIKVIDVLYFSCHCFILLCLFTPGKLASVVMR